VKDFLYGHTLSSRAASHLLFLDALLEENTVRVVTPPSGYDLGAGETKTPEITAPKEQPAEFR
jgi:hypothetical protein